MSCELVLIQPRSAPELARIYGTYFDFVRRNARRLGVPAVNADDVAQDVFLVVHRRILDFDGRAPMRAWLYGILLRVVRGRRRGFLRKDARNTSLDAVSSYRRALVDGASEFAERVDRAHLIKKLLEQIDDDDRTLLVLSELEGWTLREIAELLGSNTSTIHARLRAAKGAFERAYVRLVARAASE